MKLQDQVISLEIAKKLKELGVKQVSYFGWWKDRLGRWEISAWRSTNEAIEGGEYLSAFSVAELGEMLPEWITVSDEKCFLDFGKFEQLGQIQWECSYSPIGERAIGGLERDKNEANSRGKMLVYLLQNNLLKL